MMSTDYMIDTSVYALVAGMILRHHMPMLYACLLDQQYTSLLI